MGEHETRLLHKAQVELEAANKRLRAWRARHPNANTVISAVAGFVIALLGVHYL